MGQRSAPAPAPAPFLSKTYQLVDDERSNDVVSWNESGTTFVVWKTAEFAKDLLPNYFKHNNFSSFVRQLNTYGFRKIVPDKWEFANESFRKGQDELLCQIHRRKTAPASPAQDPEAGKASDGPSSPSNSGEDMGSTSTSSPEAKIPPSDPTRLTHLSGENEKLKRDNQILSSELAQTKKQCEELVAFLTECLKVGPDQIDRVLREGICRPSITGSVPDSTVIKDDGEEEEEEEEGLKLFGVWLKGKKKRGRVEEIGCAGPQPKEMKEAAPWMLTNKVCN